MMTGCPRQIQVTPNNSMQLTGRFLRFGGHPELTVQESSHAKARSKNDVSL
jgi:hypothetical protein